MKSGKQRKAEIRKARLKKAEKNSRVVDVYNPPIPKDAVKADANALAHNSYFVERPLFYIDRPFTCKDCGSNELWTAKQQKWWYEIAKGNLESIAIRCRSCRNKIKREKRAQKAHMEEVANRKPHPNEAFFKNT